MTMVGLFLSAAAITSGVIFALVFWRRMFVMVATAAIGLIPAGLTTAALWWIIWNTEMHNVEEPRAGVFALTEGRQNPLVQRVAAPADLELFYKYLANGNDASQIPYDDRVALYREAERAYFSKIDHANRDIGIWGCGTGLLLWLTLIGFGAFWPIHRPVPTR
jgi:hypothetical protein